MRMRMTKRQQMSDCPGTSGMISLSLIGTAATDSRRLHYKKGEKHI